MIKNLYCIRNAINYNNKITTNGVSQINTLRKSWKDINDIESGKMKHNPTLMNKIKRIMK